MATLGGLFESQPRCKRNFLLENIRDVRKERLKKKPSHTQMVKLGQCTHKASQSILKLSEPQTNRSKRSSVLVSPPKNRISALKNSYRQIGNTPKGYPDSGSQTSCQLHNLHRQNEGNSTTDSSQEDAIPFKYVDEENVPFRWEQVCPSHISRTVRHQSVQTLNEDDWDSLLEEGSIKDPSAERIPETIRGNVNDDRITTLEWPVNTEDDASLPSEKEISSGSVSSKLTGPGHSLSVDDTGQVRRNVTHQDRSRGSESSGKQPSVIIQGIRSASQQPHFPLSPKTNVEENTGLYRSQNIGKKIENLEITSMKSNRLNAEAPTSNRKGVVQKYFAKNINDQNSFLRRTESNEAVSPEMHRRLALQEATTEFDVLIAELNKMPVRTDTLRTKQRKIEIEKELNMWEKRIISLTKTANY